MIELVKKNYFFKIQMMKMWRLARAEGSEENHEYFKFLKKRKAACPASLFHSHTPQLVPVKRYYTHRTCHSWSPDVSDAAKCLIMFGIVQECLQFILAKHDNNYILWRNNIAPENIAVIMFSCFIEMTHPSVLLPTTYELPLHSPFLPVVVCHSAIVFHSAILP